MKAVEVLMEHGVPEERIIFINLVDNFTHTSLYPFSYCQIASPEGLTTFCAKYPQLKVVCSTFLPLHLLSSLLRRLPGGLIKGSMKRHTLYQAWVISGNAGLFWHFQRLFTLNNHKHRYCE